MLQLRLAQDQLQEPQRLLGAAAAARRAVVAYQATREAAQEASAWRTLAEAQGDDGQAAREAIAMARRLAPEAEKEALELLATIHLRHGRPLEAVDAAKELVSRCRQAGR